MQHRSPLRWMVWMFAAAALSCSDGAKAPDPSPPASAELGGTVVDGCGAPLPGVAVTADCAGGLAATTDASGAFHLSSSALAAGLSCVVTASSDGRAPGRWSGTLVAGPNTVALTMPLVERWSLSEAALDFGATTERLTLTIHATEPIAYSVSPPSVPWLEVASGATDSAPLACGAEASIILDVKRSLVSPAASYTTDLRVTADDGRAQLVRVSMSVAAECSADACSAEGDAYRTCVDGRWGDTVDCSTEGGCDPLTLRCRGRSCSPAGTACCDARYQPQHVGEACEASCLVGPTCQPDGTCGGGTEVSCNAPHGSCDVATGACACGEGFAGDHCDVCAPGYTEFPNCRPYCPARWCNEPRGTCSLDVCTCEPAFTGDHCEQCAPHYSGPSCAPTCGDGFIVAGLEACDDGNTADGDGCSSSCAPEAGWSCTGTPSFCVPPGYVTIAAGTFTMGSPTSESGRSSGEVQHTVRLGRSFLLKATEVTQGEWKALSGGVNPACFQTPSSTTCSRANANDSAPVELVTWWSAIGYMNALSAAHGLTPCYTLPPLCTAGWQDGQLSCGLALPAINAATVYACTGYRFPTEAEWEYAARAGTTGPYGTAATTLTSVGWYSANSGSHTHAVATKAANAWGLSDMHGNVWEWGHDWFDAYPSTGVTVDPAGPATGFSRVVRGGSWSLDASFVRAATRDANDGGYFSNTIGFRPARSLP